MNERRHSRRIAIELEAEFHWVGPLNASEVRLFRAPIILDGSGTHQRLPHEITWNDVSIGDLIIAVEIEPKGNPAIMSVLEIWHVAESDGDTFGVYSTRIVPAGGYGNRIYDSIARLAGLPPCSTDV